ncbi:MAG: hypothetical protein NVS4B12_12990 [Ktedonobacteraceae bacterium]
MKERTKVEDEMEQDPWLKKSEEILINVKEWRRAHPKATFVEIEDEVHKRVMQLEAHLLQEAAEASTSREWGKESSAEDRPHCPKCAVVLQARGTHQRTLQGNGGETVTLSRTYGTCPKCGESFFPSG